MSEKYFDVLAGVKKVEYFDMSVGNKKVEPVKLNIDEIGNSVISTAKAFEAEGPMSFIDELTRSVTKAMDEFILKQFERHGYSEKEVMDLAIAGKIEAVEHGNTTDYFVNGLAVFSIMRMEYTLSDDTDGYYNFSAKLICEDMMPAVRGDGDLNEDK